MAVVTPGHNPDSVFDEVAPGSALVVDQLEELFVLCADRAARARFAETLVAWMAVAPVVVTLRADFLAAVAELPELAVRVQSGVFLLGAMGEVQLRAAIEVPAAKVGLRLEPGLVDLLVHDVVGQPGALPLLSHALAETYDRRERTGADRGRVPGRGRSAGRRRPRRRFGRRLAAAGRATRRPRPVPTPGHRHRLE